MLLLDSTITSNKFNALTTDTTGHVEGLKGKVITF